MASTDQPIANPTFHQNIKAMFSQYDQVMMINYFDLHNYDQVKAWAQKFVLVLQFNEDPNLAAMNWSRLQQVHVMPEVPGPWPESWVTTFKNWVANGCPEGTPPDAPAQTPVAPDVLQQFIQLSLALTGMDDFGPNANTLGAIYYNRLLIRPKSTNPNDTIQGIMAAWTPGGNLTTLAQSFPIYKDIILLWYNTTTNWDNQGNALPAGNPPYFGTPDFNQYKQSMLGKVILAHPAAYAPENTPRYWEMPPTPDGQYTGYYDKNY